jgi:DNA mismatch repair protein MutH
MSSESPFFRLTKLATGDFWEKKRANMDKGYDSYDIDSIVEYATKLEGKTLRQMTGLDAIADPHQRRGSFGNAVEEYYFKYPINSSQVPDFDKVGLELKTTPLKRNSSGELVAKERLVITNIDYMGIVNENFEESHFLKKTADVLLITYLYEKDKSPLDYTIELVARWGIPEEDFPQIRHDWETVVEKVRSGHAEDISGGDTLYLEACTKAANAEVRKRQPFSTVSAKPRAWALKASYMTTVQRKLLKAMSKIPRTRGEESMDLLALLHERFAPYFGKTELELEALFALSASKNLCARITNKILGVGEDSEIEEFQKAGIKPKTMRLKASGVPKEAVSFPAFRYDELVARPFENSAFLGYLQQKYLFVIYKEDKEGNYLLSDICFWQMPEKDLDEARLCYEQMQDNVRKGQAAISIKSADTRCCHVRPHGRNAEDVCPQPFGPPVVKKSFWLNQNYLKDEIESVLGEDDSESINPKNR